MSRVEKINLTAIQILALMSALSEDEFISKVMGEDADADEDKVSKVSVNYRAAPRCGNCAMYDNGTCTLVAGAISPMDFCDKWDPISKYGPIDYADDDTDAGENKSAETPSLMATPDILGPEGLWHTPSKKVPTKQKLPNYIEHIADALMRAGHGEQEAIAFAVNAVKRWSRGELGWGKKKVTPTVQAAAKKTLEEWEKLKQTHH